MYRFLFVATILCATLLPTVTSAHEVYVLSPEVVQQAVHAPAFSEVDVAMQESTEFLWWAFVGLFVVALVFFMSVSRSVERVLDPYLAPLPYYAPFVGRVTIGLAFCASAYYGALFGPELPLVGTFGTAAPLVQVILFCIGIVLVLGIYPRVASAIALVLFGWTIAVHGVYMLTYTNYVGELVLVLILGAHVYALHTKHTDTRRAPAWLLRGKQALTPYAFLLLRVGFGGALIYASLYAKIIHNQLAFALTQAYPNLVMFFGFEPHFLVLGAALVELCIGTFFILGFEIRFTSLFLLFWLSLSLWYFGELVWPHLILIGIPISFIFYGYDKYSIEGYFFKRGSREPVL